ncbi:MAG: HAD family hydrolase, partial [Candidatus Babeliales bacterium]
DRDGTIIKNTGYLSSADQIELIEGAVQLCRLCQDKGYQLILVTNQSGVARGYFDESFVQATHEYLFNVLAKHEVFFTKAYYCPHHPKAQVKDYARQCQCRKPGPGMLLSAAVDYDLDLSASVMIGDTDVDIKAGVAAGCRSFDILSLLNLNKADLENLF